MKENDIINYVVENQVIIAKGGNSGNMPIFLANASYKVIVASFESYIKYKYKESRKDESIETVTRGNISNEDIEDYQIAYIPYGSYLVQEIFKNKDDKKAVLIIEDSYNYVNADLLLGFADRLIKDGAQLRLVIINKIPKYDAKLSEFFADAPIISMNSSKKQKQIPMKFHSANDLKKVILSTFECHKNLLVILPKNQIKELKKNLDSYFENSFNKPVVIDWDPKFEYQKLDRFQTKVTLRTDTSQSNYYRVDLLQKKIILATEVFPNISACFKIDAVIDSGLERKWKIVDGVPVCVQRNISKFTIEAHKAVLNEVQSAEYHLCSDCSYESRKEVSTVIEEYFDNMILTVISLNMDINKIHLFYGKSKYIISCYLKQLQLLECIDQSGKITDIGKKVLKVPMNVRFSRMLIEAKKYNLEFDVLLGYLVSKFEELWFGRVDNGHAHETELKSDLLFQIYMLKRAYFEKINPNSRDFEKKKKCKGQIKKFISMMNITPSNYSNVQDMKKCIACGFPDCLFILTSRTSYQNNKSSKYHYIIPNASTLGKNQNSYIVSIFATNHEAKYPFGGLTNLTTAFTLGDVMEYYSKYLQDTYSILEGRNIFKNKSYNGISVEPEFLGTVEELKESCPEAFHQKKELDEVTGKDVLCTYFHDLKVSSIPYVKLI